MRPLILAPICHAVLVASLVAPALVTAQENLGTYEDRIAVEDVLPDAGEARWVES